MKDLQRIGILTSIEWNSKRWKEYPDPIDIEKANFDYVQEHGVTHTHLNFEYENLPPDSGGYIYALLPQLWNKVPQSDNVEAVIIRSKNWRDVTNYIVGFYLFPKFKGKVAIAEFPQAMEREVNIKSLAKDTVLLDNYIKLTNENLVGFLPAGTELGSRGFNYLSIDNVLKILDAMTDVNPENAKLKNLKYKFLRNNGKA